MSNSQPNLRVTSMLAPRSNVKPAHSMLICVSSHRRRWPLQERCLSYAAPPFQCRYHLIPVLTGSPQGFPTPLPSLPSMASRPRRRRSPRRRCIRTGTRALTCTRHLPTTSKLQLTTRSKANEDSILAVQVFDQKKFKKKDQGFLGVINIRIGDVIELAPDADGMASRSCPYNPC